MQRRKNANCGSTSAALLALRWLNTRCCAEVELSWCSDGVCASLLWPLLCAASGLVMAQHCIAAADWLVGVRTISRVGDAEFRAAVHGRSRDACPRRRSAVDCDGPRRQLLSSVAADDSVALPVLHCSACRQLSVSLCAVRCSCIRNCQTNQWLC